MGRPAKPPREWWDAERGEWCILHAGRRVRLGLPKDAVDAARLAVAEYVVKLAKGAPEAPTERAARDVACDEVLELYLARRTDDDPEVRDKHVARPRELAQRIGRLASYWAGKPVSAVTDKTCKAFVRSVGSESYGRRCLGDFQAALNEAQRAGLFREEILVTLPPPPEPRQDHLTTPEVLALLRVAVGHRDVQQRRVGGRFEIVDGRKRLVGGTPTTITGSKRPWLHVAKFLLVALATCSRSSRVYEASYEPEPGRPWVDLKAGVLYRTWRGERKSKKRAPTIPLSPRLVDAMRRWASDRVVAGKVVSGDKYVVQWAGKAADPKGAWSEVVKAARAKHPTLFLRDDGSAKAIVRHTLRHTGVTMLAADPELSVAEVCAYAGMTTAMFERVYGHNEQAMKDKVAQTMGRRKRGPKRRKVQDEGGEG